MAAMSAVRPKICGMSMLKLATIDLRGTGGWATNQALPSSPLSSPAQARNSSDLRGASSMLANASASATIEATPRALSQAPLNTVSPSSSGLVLR